MTGSSPPETDEAVDRQPEPPSDGGNTLKGILKGAAALGLLSGTKKDAEQVDWYEISVTTYRIGVFILLFSSFIVLISMVGTYLTMSRDLIEAASRVSSTAPLIPVILATYAYFANRAWHRMSQSPPTEGSIIEEWRNISFGRRSRLMASSYFSLGLAIVLRSALLAFYPIVLNGELVFTDIVAVLILDGLYIGPLLTGVGGIAALLLEPK